MSVDIRGDITETVSEYLYEQIPDLFLEIEPKDYVGEQYDDRCDTVAIYLCPLFPVAGLRPLEDCWVNVHFWNEGVDISDDKDLEEHRDRKALAYAQPDFLDLVVRAVRERLYDQPRTVFTGNSK